MVKSIKCFSRRDRPLWGDGVWQNEPDDLLWEDRNYQCKISRTGVGYLYCAVYLKVDHPLFDIEIEKINSILNLEINQKKLVNCPKEGKLYQLEIWLGPLDYKFETPHNYKIDPLIYKDMKFAKKECKKIVNALCLTYSGL